MIEIHFLRRGYSLPNASHGTLIGWEKHQLLTHRSIEKTQSYNSGVGTLLIVIPCCFDGSLFEHNIDDNISW